MGAQDDPGQGLTMLRLMLITPDPDMAAHAAASGVDRIFVDLEILGKQERQGHLDTVISGHTLEDVARVRAAIPSHPLLVRLNPPNPGTGLEVEAALAAGADLLMLPMFSTAEEVRSFTAAVAGRAETVLLLETARAAANLDEILEVEGIDEIHIGLNDLHLSLGLDFLFEPLASGLVETLGARIRGKGLRFGFGGVGRLDGAPLPGLRVLGEHVRLQSSAVILSRSFHGGSRNLEELRRNVDLASEVRRLRDAERAFGDRSPDEAEEDARATRGIILQIAEQRRARGPA